MGCVLALHTTFSVRLVINRLNKYDGRIKEGINKKTFKFW